MFKFIKAGKLKKKWKFKKIKYRQDNYNTILDRNQKFQVNSLIFNKKK